MTFRVRGDITAPKGCAICGKPLAEHRVGNWCRPGFDPLPTDTPAIVDTRERTPMPTKTRKSYDHTRWLKEIAVAVGADKPRPCPDCHGSGSIQSELRVNEAAAALLPVSYALTAIQLASRLTNPSLADLEHIRDATGADTLDEAASWSREIAAQIREALGE